MLGSNREHKSQGHFKFKDMNNGNRSSNFEMNNDTSDNDGQNLNLVNDDGACSLSNLDKTIALKLKKGAKNATTLVSKKNTVNTVTDSKKALVAKINTLQKNIGPTEKN
jgi:hypothetical protein